MKLRIVLTGAAAVFAFVVFGAAFYVYRDGKRYAACYVISPDTYRQQARLIRHGSDSATVGRMLRGVSRVVATSGTISFAMDPNTRRQDLIREPRTVWIHVTVATDGSVREVSASEGRIAWQFPPQP